MLVKNFIIVLTNDIRFSSKKLIAEAINDNDFLKNLDKKQIAEIVGCMYQREFKQHQYICKEGGVGTQLYVLASNDVKCVQIIMLIMLKLL